jgi:hypothetical protein
MTNKNHHSPEPIPFSGYIDLALSILVPLVGVSFVLLLVFWFAVRPSVPDTAIVPSVVGIVTVSLIVGIINAARYYRKKYQA